MDWSGARLSIQIAVERDSMAVGQREKRGIGENPRPWPSCRDLDGGTLAAAHVHSESRYPSRRVRSSLPYTSKSQDKVADVHVCTLSPSKEPACGDQPLSADLASACILGTDKRYETRYCHVTGVRHAWQRRVPSPKRRIRAQRWRGREKIMRPIL